MYLFNYSWVWRSSSSMLVFFIFLFTSNWKVECKLDQQIRTLSAVKRVFYTLLWWRGGWTASQSCICILTFTCGQDIWAVTKRVRSQIQESFLHRVAEKHEELRYPERAESRANTHLHWREPLEVVWESDKRASWVAPFESSRLKGNDRQYRSRTSEDLSYLAWEKEYVP